MKLYEISKELQGIFDDVSEDGELTDEMIGNLNGLQQDFEVKAISVAAYIKNIEAEEAAIANAIKNMGIRKLRLTKQVQGLTDYLQYNMQRLSIIEIKSSPYFKISLKQCPPSIDVFDEKQIPSEFWREKVTASVDKIMLKKVINDGVDVPGASIQRKIKLEIK